MPSGQTWPPEVKAEALRLYQLYGAREACEATGVANPTVRLWASQAGVHAGRNVPSPEGAARQREGAAAYQARRRSEVSERLLTQIHDLFDRMGQSYVDYVGVQAKQVTYESPPPKAVRDLAVSLAVLLDKLRLEEGKSTSHAANRVEVSNGGSPVDSAIAGLLAEFDERERTRLPSGSGEDTGGMEPAGPEGTATPGR